MTLNLKVQLGATLRRISLPVKSSLKDAQRAVEALLDGPGGSVAFKYRDEDGDFITIGSESEWQHVAGEVKDGGVLRLLAEVKPAAPQADKPEVPSEQPSAPATPPPPREPEVPFIALARALADPETVARIQASVGSQIVLDAVTNVARAYTDSKGDLMATWLSVSQHLPLLYGVLQELVHDVPALKELHELLACGNVFGGFGMRHHGRAHHHHGPPHCDPHHGHPHPGPHCDPHHGPHHHGHPHPGPHCDPRHGPHPHGHPGPHCDPRHGPHPHGHPGPHCDPRYGPHHGPNPHRPGMGPGMCRTVHPGVFCDGCQGDGALKRASFTGGFMTRRGFINGTRYKSQTVHDFDLCESCHKSGQFSEAAYGPFAVIQPPAAMHGAGRTPGGCQGGWWAARGAGEDGNWRTQPRPAAATQESASAPPASSEDAAEPPQKKQPFDFFGDALREAISKGAQAVANATKDEDNEFAEIARAIAESLQEKKPASTSSSASQAVPVPVVDSPKREPASANGAASDGEESATSHEDWENVTSVGAKAASSSDPFTRWGKELAQLQQLGFTESETYITFLEEEHGDLDRVVSRIVSRDA